MLDSLKIIFDEALSVYKLGTLDGRLFIPFVICCIYLLLSPAEEDARARHYFVYPSLVLMLFIFNPVFIHYMIKFMGDPERVVRIFWPLPMGAVMVYCVLRGLRAVNSRARRGILILAAALTLLLVTEGNHAGISFTPAENPQKLIKGSKELSDTIYTLSEGQEARVLFPNHMYFWIREYNAAILTPFENHADFMYDDDGNLDLDAAGENAREAGCDYVVISTAAPAHGALEDYGYQYAASVTGDNCEYIIYSRAE